MIYSIGVRIANLEKLSSSHFVVSEEEIQKLISTEVTSCFEALLSQLRANRTIVLRNIKSAELHSAFAGLRSSITVVGEWLLLVASRFMTLNICRFKTFFEVRQSVNRNSKREYKERMIDR